MIPRNVPLFALFALALASTSPHAAAAMTCQEAVVYAQKMGGSAVCHCPKACKKDDVFAPNSTCSEDTDCGTGFECDEQCTPESCGSDACADELNDIIANADSIMDGLRTCTGALAGYAAYADVGSDYLKMGMTVKKSSCGFALTNSDYPAAATCVGAVIRISSFDVACPCPKTCKVSGSSCREDTDCGANDECEDNCSPATCGTAECKTAMSQVAMCADRMIAGFKSCATAGPYLASAVQYAQHPSSYLQLAANMKLTSCGLEAEATASCGSSSSGSDSGPSCSGYTCAQTGEMEDYTWKGGKAPEGCNTCSSKPASCAQLINAINTDGCFGECGWALSDNSMDNLFEELSCTATEIREAESALAEAKQNFDDSSIAAKAGLSVVAALAAAVAVACHAV